MALERNQAGVLMLTRPGGAKECAVPANLKLEKDGETPAELAERAEVGGQSVSGAPIPKLSRGVLIVLVETLNTQQAEYLLALRINSIEGWNAYLGKFPSGAGSGQANATLAALYVNKGMKDLAAYLTTSKGATPDYAKLEAAKTSLDAAIARAPRNTQSDELAVGIQQEAMALSGKGQVEIAQYRAALAAQTAGYKHLLVAQQFLQLSMNFAPTARETVALRKACSQETDVLDARMVLFDNQLTSRHPDEAYDAIKPYRAFAPEYPKVQTRLHALYTYHVEQARKDLTNNDPSAAVAEYKKAAVVEPGPEIDALVAKAVQDAQTKMDNDAITYALKQSDSAEEDKESLLSYEVLADLTPAQKANPQVASRMADLQEKYAKEAPAKAREIKRSHGEISNLADEKEMQHAYKILRNCYEIGGKTDSALHDQMESTGMIMVGYYQKQAQKYMALPNGSGANVGYEYLTLAAAYNSDPTADREIKNQLVQYAPAHTLRSGLSTLVQFGDGTQRQAAGEFAGQLTTFVASGLESSNLGIKAVRPNQTDLVQSKYWNFDLNGTVASNGVAVSAEAKLPKTSKYRSGQAAQNDAWVKADSEYNHQKIEVENARAYLLKVKGNKNTKEAKQQLDDATDKLLKAGQRRDAIPRTQSMGVEESYTYTEQNNLMKAAVEVRFELKDTSGTLVVPQVTVPGMEEAQFVSLEGVKPEDSTGLRAGGDGPSEAMFLQKVDDTVRDRVLKAAREMFVTLPPVILKSADRKAEQQDKDGAAELYMLYLDTTEIEPTPDRRRAQTFLMDNFNFREYGDKPRS